MRVSSDGVKRVGRRILGPLLVLALGTAATACGGDAASGSAGGGDPIKVGVFTDLTGPLASVGQAHGNVAKMVIEQINAEGGLLNRKVELVLVDSASDPKVAVTRARELVQRDDVDVVIGGITSDTRNAVTSTVTDRGGKLYIFPNGGEAGSCAPDVFKTGATPAQQAKALVEYMSKDGPKRWYLVGSDYVAPRDIHKEIANAVRESGGTIVGESYSPIAATDFSATVSKILASRADIVHAVVIPPGITPFFRQLYDSGYTRRGGRLAGAYYDDGTFASVPPAQLEGLVSALDYYQSLDDPFDKETLSRYNAKFDEKTAPYAATGGVQAMHRALLLWAEAVRSAGSVETDAVRQALETASIEHGPGGPAEMTPEEHQPKLNLYVAQAHSGKFIVKDETGVIPPKVDKTCE